MKRPSPPSSGSLSLRLPKGFDTLNLYGSFDSHLKRVESLLHVRILARGEEIRIEGEPDQVKEARRVLHDLQIVLAGSVLDFALSWFFLPRFRTGKGL